MSDNSPNWDNMPEAKPILTLSWEDVWDKAKDVTRAKFNREPGKDEIDAIFKNIDHAGIDCESGTFWSTVEYYVDEFYSGLDK